MKFLRGAAVASASFIVVTVQEVNGVRQHRGYSLTRRQRAG